jgi:predicted N-acetyltransferase YhbS
MTQPKAPAAVLRRARRDELAAILDLLTEYDLPRSVFEPWYLHDPSYRPEQSWIVEENGCLVAHVRIFDRWVRIGGASIRVAGIGNVITAVAARGRGYAGRLLQTVVDALPLDGYAYSLLWTHLPALYARYGWASIAHTVMEARLTPVPDSGLTVVPVTAGDRAAIERLYDETNAERTGSAVRAPDYWQAQRAWLDEQPEDLLVARDGDQALRGYVRRRSLGTVTEVLELGVRPHDRAGGRALLAAAALPTDGRLRAHLPLSLAPLLADAEATTSDERGLMGRVISLPTLVQALSTVWSGRLQDAQHPGGPLHVACAAGTATIRCSPAGVQLVTDAGAGPPRLTEAELAHFLFHGASDLGEGRAETRGRRSLLHALFPAQDFVIWEADTF